MNKIKFGIFSVVALTTLSTVSIQFPAQADQYYSNPTIRSTNGRDYRISSCVNSYRFAGDAYQCSKNANNVIADKFCKNKGHRGSAFWQRSDVGWDNRITAFRWNEKYVDGQFREGFWTEPNNSILMTLIACRD